MKPPVQRGFQTPPEIIRYFEQKKLKPAFSWQDVWNEEHAYAFTVAKAVDLELLALFKTSIQKAIENGQGFETWRKELIPELQRLGWYGRRQVDDPTGAWKSKIVDFSRPARLQTIFWANVRTARAAGQWTRIQRTKRGLPYLLYVRTASVEPRQQHLAWVGLILPVDHDFWKTHFPPNGWGCKCSVRQITRMEYERLKATGDYLLDPPTIEMKQWVNARTGEVTWVPEGIDPGWGTNPGLARAKTLVENVAKRTQEAVEIARKEIKSAPPVVVTGKDFHRPGILLWGTSDSAEVFAKTWERVIGKKPADFFAALVKGAPAERMSVKISGSGKPGKPASIGTEMVLKNGRRRVAELNRTYAMDAEGELTVVHSFFLVRHDLQGSGIGVTMLRNAMAEYRRMGVRRVTTQANIDAGSYTWAKFGFAPERAEWLALRQRLRFKVQNLAGLDVIGADDLQTALDVLESDDPKAIWRVSDLRGATKVRLGKGRMATVGQALLQNENWRGILDLRDEETMTRFTAYANR